MTQTPAGWYPDPYAPGQPVLRYWDGVGWSAQTAPMPTVVGPPSTPDGQVLSGWWMRVAAYLIDDVLIGLVGLPLTLPLMIPLFRELFDRMNQVMQQANQSGTAPPLFPGYTGHELLQLALIGLIQIAIIVIYNVIFLRWKSATVGKLALGLRIRLRETPGRLSWRTVWFRVLVQWGYGFVAFVPVVSSLVSLFPFLDDLWPLWDNKKQALHDKVARTNVVRHDQWVNGQQPPTASTYGA